MEPRGHGLHIGGADGGDGNHGDGDGDGGAADLPATSSHEATASRQGLQAAPITHTHHLTTHDEQIDSYSTLTSLSHQGFRLKTLCVPSVLHPLAPATTRPFLHPALEELAPRRVVAETPPR